MRQYFKHAKKILAVCALAASAAAIQAQQFSSPPPNMPFRYGLGHQRYEENCAKCHGSTLLGSDQGPPLLHQYYVPSHHNDAAFYRAIRVGTKRHHWNYDDMPPVAGVAENEARAIVEFVRWFQQESGLY